MKIGIFQDIHANLPAFIKAVNFFDVQQCDQIIHVGDLIGIGPYPSEVFHHAISIPHLQMVMGNHDFWFAYGLPHPFAHGMLDAEYRHQLWNHQQIGEEYRELVKSWKFTVDLEVEQKIIRFQHYGYDNIIGWFRNYVSKPDIRSLDLLFPDIKADIIFYGHNHLPSDITGITRYVNLGSAGCHNKSEVRLGILQLDEKKIHLKKYCLPYEDNGLMKEFDIREVPARDFIRKTFITRNINNLNQ